MNNNYPKAYTEILEILKYLPEAEYNRIPKEQIEFYQQNCDKEYQFSLDVSKQLDEQQFLKETNAIVISLFRDYFATDTQKEKLQKILLTNEQEHQKELKEKYNTEDIFEKKENKIQMPETELVKAKKENQIQKIFNRIIKWIRKKSN